jgi:hypothetical protein
VFCYQLRIYEIFERNKSAFHERFRDHAARIMRQHGFNDTLAMWEAKTDRRTEFVYPLAWPDETAKRAAWAEFMADEGWNEIEHQSERLGVLKTYRRPLEAYFGALQATGLMAEDVREAFPTAACKERYPEADAKLSEFPHFLSFRVRCAGSTQLWHGADALRRAAHVQR